MQWAVAYLAGAFFVYTGLDPAREAWGIPGNVVKAVHILLVIIMDASHSNGYEVARHRCCRLRRHADQTVPRSNELCVSPRAEYSPPGSFRPSAGCTRSSI